MCGYFSKRGYIFIVDPFSPSAQMGRYFKESVAFIHKVRSHCLPECGLFVFLTIFLTLSRPTFEHAGHGPIPPRPSLALVQVGLRGFRTQVKNVTVEVIPTLKYHF